MPKGFDPLMPTSHRIGAWCRCRAGCTCEHCTQLQEVQDALETAYTLLEEPLVRSSRRVIEEGVGKLERELAGLVLIDPEIFARMPVAPRVF